MRLLYIEDEIDIARPLITALKKRKYAVDYAQTGTKGLELSKINEYDCIILDLNLPEIDGIEITKQIRDSQNFTPILMLTARISQDNIEEGFIAGTDDYLTKPFYFKELLLRIESLIKRNSYNRSEKLQIQGISVELDSKRIFIKDKEIELNAKEYGIFEYLMRNKGRAISQEELLEHVWDRNIDIFTQTVRTNIKTLRQKVDPDKVIIKTIVGKGYIIK